MKRMFISKMMIGFISFFVVFALAPGQAVAALCGTPATVSLDATEKDVLPEGHVDYTITITNNHGSSCDIDLAVLGDDTGFTSTFPGGTPITVANGATEQTTLRVSVSGQEIGSVNDTNLTVDDSIINVITTVNNPLLHNSFNLGSTKWSGDGGWGLSTNKYGAITCKTCHAKNTGNIKRVVSMLPSAAVAIPDDFPGAGGAVNFQTVVDGSSDFGDDTGGHATSDKICEVCHTITKYHRYDTATQVADGGSLGHFNNKDCIQCHAHSEGFKAGACSGCHGGGTTGTGGKNFWPDGSNANLENDEPGRHVEHMDALVSLVYPALVDSTGLLNDPSADSKQTDLCGYCHDNPGGDGDHGNPADLPAEVAMHPAWDKAAAASGSYTTADGNCTNICHNNHPSGVGTYGWLDAGTTDCIMCHNDVTVSTNTTGNTHLDHTGAAADFGRAIDCDDCHDAATSWATNTKPASNHIDGTLDASGVVTLTYDGISPPGTSYGTCATNACHNDGTAAVGAPINATYVWSDDGLNDCGICHAGAPATNDHPSHTDTADDKYGSTANTSWNAYDNDAADTSGYDFGCGNCHGDTLGNHLNGARNVSGTGWNGSTCNTAYCHSHKDTDGVTTVNVTTPAWGSGFPAGDRCAQCHLNSPESSGHEEHQVGFHYNAIYSGKREFLPVLNSDPKPANIVNAAILSGPVDEPFDTIRGHGGYSYNTTTTSYDINSTTMTCYVCHNNTVTDKGNDLNPVCANCHDGTKAPLEGTMTVANTNFHVNGTPDVVFMNEVVRSKAQVRDDLADVPEIANNWKRVNNYKQNDGSSYDESTDTLANLAATYGGWVTVDTARATLPDGTQPARTCMISCHLWEDNRVDKYPIHWDNNSIHGSQPIMCIDCHSRLPK